MTGEQTLQVKIISFFNPSYEPSGSFVGFGNAHNGQPFIEFDIKVNSPLAVSENVFEPIKDECESVLITDETAKQYGISKPGENTAINVSIKDAQTKGEPFALRGEGPDAELLMYGSETPYDYYKPEINADIYGEMGLGGKRSIPRITTRKHSAW